MNAISEALVFAVIHIAGASATAGEREDADVSALEGVGAILRNATAAERVALRAAVDDAIKREQNTSNPDAERIANYKAFIESYLSE
jgi:hypothetical protein